MIKTNEILDAKGLACPMPIVKTRKAIKEMNAGEVLEVQSTDSGTGADLKAWSESAGHQYIGNVKEGEMWRHFIRKNDSGQAAEQTHPHTVSNAELAEKLQQPNAVLLDVRESAEFAFSHIKNAVSVPLGTLQDESGSFDKTAEIYVICRSGSRSDLACRQLAAQGFENVFNVVPGMAEWNGETENTAGGM